MDNYTVGIVTYVERFQKWFQPLVRQIKKQKPDIEMNLLWYYVREW